jgi:hypothetical protein
MPVRRVASDVNINKNVNWLNNPGMWTWYISLIVACWLIVAGVLDDGGLAWTFVHLIHGFATYYLLHWTKGSPCHEEQGKYEGQTFWEQIDNGSYATRNRKFLTAVPLVLFALATHGTQLQRQPLGLNLLVVVVLIVAKLPQLHGVRIFGINQY